MVFSVQHRVALSGEANDAGRLGVVRAHSDENRILRRDHPNDRAHGGCDAFVGLDLGETSDGVGSGPRRLTQLPIDANPVRRLRQSHGGSRERISDLSRGRLRSAKHQAER